MSERRDEESLREERRRIVRRITLWTYGFAVAALLIAAGGGALLAWLLTGIGFPFLRTWLLIAAIMVLVPIMVHLGQSIWASRTEHTRDDE